MTVYDSMNYGSFLQAYALKTFLEKEQHEVSFLKWNKNKNIAWNSVIKPIVFRKSISIRGIKAGMGRIESFKSIKGYFRETDTVRGLDLIIVGSDTLWDVARTNFRDKALYGCFESDIPVISYAVSCSESTEDDFKKYLEITKSIRCFKNILVRDYHTKTVVKKSLGIDSEIVCDPTLLVNENTWKLYPIKKDLSNIILVYTYEFSSEIIGHLKKFSREKELKLVSLCIYQPWCELHLNCTPLEFPSYLKLARYVVTNTFHGTIFSVLSESNLISVKNGNKLKNLIQELFGYDISLNSQCTYDEFLEKTFCEIDFKKIKIKIYEYRERSAKLFRGILKEINIVQQKEKRD